MEIKNCELFAAEIKVIELALAQLISMLETVLLEAVKDHDSLAADQEAELLYHARNAFAKLQATSGIEMPDSIVSDIKQILAGTEKN